MPTRLFTTWQVARILGATSRDVKQWMDNGWLSHQQLPDGAIRISEQGLVAFLKERGVDIGAIMAKIAVREAQDQGRYEPVRPPSPLGLRADAAAPQSPPPSEPQTPAEPEQPAEPPPPGPQERPEAPGPEAPAPPESRRAGTQAATEPAQAIEAQPAAQQEAPAPAEPPEAQAQPPAPQAHEAAPPQEIEAETPPPLERPATPAEIDEAQAGLEALYAAAKMFVPPQAPAEPQEAQAARVPEAPPEPPAAEEQPVPPTPEAPPPTAEAAQPSPVPEEPMAAKPPAEAPPAAPELPEAPTEAPVPEERPAEASVAPEPLAEGPCVAEEPMAVGRPAEEAEPLEPPWPEEPAAPGGEGDETPPVPQVGGRGWQVGEAILETAAAAGATDVYLQPSESGLRLRMRVHGAVVEKEAFRRRLPEGSGEQVVAYFRSLVSGQEPHGAVVRGRLVRTIRGRRMRLDVGSWPTVYGPAAAVALNPMPLRPAELAGLGLERQDAARLGRLLARPGGLILSAGRSARDVRRTLRAMLAQAAWPQRQVLTVERSARVEIEGALQACADPGAGFGFAEAANVLGGQNADVILIESLRDPATTRAAMDAAEDGATVLAGIQADSAASAIEMLVTMGCERWPLSATLWACVAQATVRELCPDCQEPGEIDDRLLARLGLSRQDVDFPTYLPHGCQTCSGTGYAGTFPLFGVLYVTGAVQRVLREGPDASALRQAAEASGMTTLLQAALKEARAGRISLQEIADLALFASGEIG